MQKPSLFSTGQRTPYLSVRAEGPRQSFLSAVFTHRRSRSADTRDVLPPSYESLVAPRWGKPSLKYTSSSLKHWRMALEILRKYDTVILVDDSGSMTLPGSKKGRTRWNEAGEALETLAEAAQQYDRSLNIKSSSEVRALFAQVKPSGATPTGERLDQILKPRLRVLEEARIEPDGTPSDKESGEELSAATSFPADNPKYAILDAASRLKAMQNLCMISLESSLFKLENDSRATKALKELDDDLHKTRNIRDIVDTTPYSKLNPSLQTD
ncbi:hypothetical protein B0H14DRAFT_2685070 [Mycena olivaceomarginata]|nr:hypothetical protein B0H14DRAFT_2685070 [Mycena olivaceomarginata]